MFSATWTSSSSPVRHFLYGDIQCLLCKHGCPSWFGWIKFLFFQQYNRFSEAETQIKDVIIWNCEVRMRLFCLFTHKRPFVLCVFFLEVRSLIGCVVSLSVCSSLVVVSLQSSSRTSRQDAAQRCLSAPVRETSVLFTHFILCSLCFT